VDYTPYIFPSASIYLCIAFAFGALERNNFVAGDKMQQELHKT
jgi:hypothetical protein